MIDLALEDFYGVEEEYDPDHILFNTEDDGEDDDYDPRCWNCGRVYPGYTPGCVICEH